MAEMIPAQVHQDIEDIGKAVNTDAIIKPRYGAPFKSLPMIAREIYADVLDLRENKANKTEVKNALSEKASKSEVVAAVAPKADKDYVDSALSSFQNGAIKTYPTLAAANADIANISLNTKVSILSETDGGDYYKVTSNATSLTKSPYDPVQTAVREAKTYTDQKALSKDEFNNIWDVNITLKQFDSWSPYSVGFVGLNGKMPFGIRKDGATVAQKMIAEDLETSSQTISDVKLQKFDPFTGYVFGIGNGSKYPLAMRNDGAIEIEKLIATNIESPALDNIKNNAKIKKATQEWWISPIHTYVDFPYPRIVSGVYSENGEIVVSEYVIGVGTTKRIVVDSTPAIDDHNAPSLWINKGHRALLAWTQHNVTSDIELLVSDKSASLQSFKSAEKQLIAAGGAVSYTQIHHIENLSDATQDTFWIFSRLDSRYWNVISISVNQETGVATRNFSRRLLSATQQYYATTARHENKIRIASGFNPAQPNNFIDYLELDVLSGDVSTADGTVLANLITNTNLPIAVSTLTHALPQTDENTDRRLFYVRSGLNPAIAIAEWNIADTDNALYKVASLESGTWVIRNVVNAGKRFGYTSEANYLSGISFPNPCYQDELYVARYDNANSQGVLERATLVDGEYVLEESVRVNKNHILRPINPENGGDICMYTQLYEYGKTSTFSFVSDIKSIFMG